jgi:hypothetical protein
MNLGPTIALALDPAEVLRRQGLQPDPWQLAVLRADDRYLLLNCSRQSGKSTTVAALALHTALFTPGALVLLLSPSLRQSMEIFRKVLDGYRAVGRPVAATYHSQLRLELANRSRLVCLPGREATIRSFSGVTLLVLDEAARVPDDLYRAVRPMLAVSRGRLICLSTPFGQRGFFYEAWQGGAPWRRCEVTWQDCPRITADFLAEEERALGPAWVEQEYNCRFTALEGLVYPDFAAALVDEAPGREGRWVGGIDFGWRNPFAAVWGVLDRDDVLWLVGERYRREQPLSAHAAALPRNVTWFADPAGRTEIEELRRAGLTVLRGNNAIGAGIAAVRARLASGRLKVLRPRCPHLVAEAQLYRYPTRAEAARPGENPLDEHNHALGALRYLVSRLDAHYLARPRPTAANQPVTVPPARDRDHPDLWTRVY